MSDEEKSITPELAHDDTPLIGIDGVEPTPDMVLALFTRMSSAKYTSPLPPPDVLREYEDVMPGLSERIVGLMITEADFRRTETAKETKRAFMSDIGTKIVNVIAICAPMTATIVALYLGAYTAATIMGSFTVVSLASIVIAKDTKRLAEILRTLNPFTKGNGDSSSPKHDEN